MSIANDAPDEMPEQPQGEVIIPLKSMSKTEIEHSVRNWLQMVIVSNDPPEAYVHLKQMEEAVKKGIEILKEQAFNATGDRFRGQMSGTILGHQVKLSYPEKWQYSVAVKRLELQQKLVMDALKAKERAEGIATKEPGKGIIAITLTT